MGDVTERHRKALVECLGELSALESGPDEVRQVVQELSLDWFAVPFGCLELCGGENVFAHDVCSCSMLDSGAGVKPSSAIPEGLTWSVAGYTTGSWAVVSLARSDRVPRLQRRCLPRPWQVRR